MSKANPAALLPILVFLCLISGPRPCLWYVLKTWMGFYSIPIVVIFLIALLVACCQNRALSFDEKAHADGLVGDKNIITMLLIFLAAGMFVVVGARVRRRCVLRNSIIPSKKKFAVARSHSSSCLTLWYGRAAPIPA